MEKIKVNMSPNPLDVQTIHASQNDGEARQWEFELHNNGELIDTSEVTEQLVFKAYKGGTEQLLPENGSTPTTSPFDGTIKYPSGSVDSYFTYRESPTEEDGLAKITDIKGNALVWNQLWDYENISFQQGLTVTKPGNGVYLINGTRETTASGTAINILKAGHKYLIKSNTDDETIVVTNSITWQSTQATYFLNATADGSVTYFINAGTYTDVKFIPQVFDLTAIFGAGNEPSTLDEFTSLFPLPYYSYNQGSLLSFNGNGIKTTGKNLLSFPYATSSTSVVTVNNDGSLSVNKTSSGDVYFNFYTSNNGLKLPSGDYIIKSHNALPSNVGIYCVVRLNGTTITNISLDRNNLQRTINIPNGAIFICYMQLASSFIGQTEIKLTMSVEDMDAFEPYTSSTLSLPISTYFPNGMKSAGNVYDEWTPSKATPRVGQLILNGTQTPRLTGITANQVFSFDNLLASAPCKTVNTNITSIYGIGASYSTIAYDSPKVAFSTVTTPLLIFPSGRFSNVNELLTYLQSNPVPINYELATPTETSFTTASLVTENAEIPLSNNDGTLIGKCTEQLSENPGFIDAKIKLSDADGECYSNKIQLHIERKPS